MLWLVEWFSTNKNSHLIGNILWSLGHCVKGLFQSQLNILIVGSIYLFLSAKLTTSSVRGVGALNKTELWDYYILLLQGDCPKWLRIEIEDFSEITKTNRLYNCFLWLLSNNYLTLDRYWFKFASLQPFHPIKRLWRSF